MYYSETYRVGDTYCREVCVWRVTDQNERVIEYAAPNDLTGILVGKAILFNCHWPGDCGFKIEVQRELGGGWVVMEEQY